MLHSISRRLSAAVAACSILAIAAPAQAAVVAVFDPAFGPAIPNLGFRGTITLDVTPPCYTLGSGFQITGGSCQITAQSAQIDFYNVATPSTILTSVALNSGFFASNYVFGAYYDLVTGQVAGLDTNDSSIFNVAVTDPNPLAPISYSGSMVLYFASGFAPSRLPVVPGAYLRNCRTIQGSSCLGNQTDTSNPGSLTFTTVPEPDSVALALLGLGVLAFARRRASKIAA